VRERIANLAEMQRVRLDDLTVDADFINPRQLGTITALDLAAPDAGYLADIGPKLYAFFQSRDVLLRPLGNTIYVMPPYCIEAASLDRVYDAIHDAADELL
jgi:adenosylmethionine-8-amino-7-oxononanoate aminotransferase